MPLECRVPCLEKARFSNLSHTVRLIMTQGSDMQAAQAGRKASVGVQTGIREAGGGGERIMTPFALLKGRVRRKGLG